MYTPKPTDTSGVELPADLMKLAEDLARNVHDVWAAARIAEGWTYGPVRDDANRRTPCLVPYDELPESERDYDRRTSQETLRYIISRGFKIEKDE